jgi:putative tryptophan/tyrosine transport system substrate-binding protein
MDRRIFNSSVAFGFGVVPNAVYGQKAKMPLVGILSSEARLSPPSPLHAAFRQALRELGYIEGSTVAIEFQSAEGMPQRLPAHAAELVKRKVDVIVTAGELAIRAAKEATSTIPVVMAVSADPVETGLVASLARPGGNVTGFTVLSSTLTRKRLELLKQTATKAVLIAVLQYPAERVRYSIEWDEAQSAAATLGIRLRQIEVRDANGFAAAFAAMQKERVEGFLVPASPFFFSNRAGITELALQFRIPAIYEQRLFVEAGGLMSYGPSIVDMWRRAAIYVDKILKGATPADLPVELPTKFEFVINARTVKTLGLAVPQSLLQLADVIQ